LDKKIRIVRDPGWLREKRQRRERAFMGGLVLDIMAPEASIFLTIMQRIIALVLE